MPWRYRGRAGAAVLGVDQLAVPARPAADREVLGVAAAVRIGRSRPRVAVGAIAAQQPAGRRTARRGLQRRILEKICLRVRHVHRHGAGRRRVAGRVYRTNGDRVGAIGDVAREPVVGVEAVCHRRRERAVDQEVDVVDRDVVGCADRNRDASCHRRSVRGRGKRDGRRSRVGVARRRRVLEAEVIHGDEPA